ncbi:hypothetical protein ABKN59_007931 [Abortiporus biennis]
MSVDISATDSIADVLVDPQVFHLKTSQIKALRIDLSRLEKLPQIHRLLTSPAPLLETLDIQAFGVCSRVHSVLFSGEFPVLRRLSVDAFDPGVNKFSNLSHLALENLSYAGDDIFNLYSLLQDSPTLEELNLNEISLRNLTPDQEDQFQRQTKLDMLHLHMISISLQRGVAITRLLLSILKLRPHTAISIVYDDDDDVIDNMFDVFPSRSDLSHLSNLHDLTSICFILDGTMAHVVGYGPS